VRKHHQKKKSSTVGESTNRGQDGVQEKWQENWFIISLAVLLNYPVILDKPLSFNFPMDFENSL
jgi:hypothetical protein